MSPGKDLDHETRALIRAVVSEAIARNNFVDHEARGMTRDLRQVFESHERIHVEIAQRARESAAHADEQRQRIENKLDQFIKEQDGKETRIMVALIGVLISIIVFFLVPFFQRGGS